MASDYGQFVFIEPGFTGAAIGVSELDEELLRLAAFVQGEAGDGAGFTRPDDSNVGPENGG